MSSCPIQRRKNVEFQRGTLDVLDNLAAELPARGAHGEFVSKCSAHGLLIET